jgi:hypothetical protein
MRSSDLFTTIAEKSRPTATPNSLVTRDGSRTTDPGGGADETRGARCEANPRTAPGGDRRPRTAPHDAPPVVSRRSSVRSWHAGLPLPSTRFGDVRRRGFAHLIQRGRGRYSFWIHTLSPPLDFELSALSPGSAYRDDAIRPYDVRDAIRRRIGFRPFREFERSRTCGSRRSRTRYTRHATHGHTPKSAIRSIVVLVVRGVRVGHAKGACPMPKAQPLQYIQFYTESYLRHTIQVSTSSRSCTSCDSHAATRGSTIPPLRFEDRHTPSRPPIRSLVTESAMCTGARAGLRRPVQAGREMTTQNNARGT